MPRLIPLILFSLLLPPAAAAQGIITTVAGNGLFGFSGDGGLATSARLADPVQVAVDAAGNLYIADRFNHRIRRVDAATGIITTVAGNGTRTGSIDGPGGNLADDLGDGGLATSASLSQPRGVAVDAAGNPYIGDAGNCRIRKVDATTGIITTVAGTRCGFFDNILATSARLNLPFGAAIDAAGNLFIADFFNSRIRKVDASTSIITTVAGTGRGFNGDNIPATSASLFNPAGVAVDVAGNLFIADFRNHRVRKVDATTGIITTVAGTGGFVFNGDNIPATSANVSFPIDVAIDAAGNLFIADFSNQRIRKVDATTGIITTVAGTGAFPGGFNGDNIPATSATLRFPRGVAVDAAGNLFIADRGNQRIRRVSAPNQPPVADAGPDQSVECSSPASTAVTLDGGGSNDPDGDPLSFEWKDAGGTVVGNDAVVNLTLPLGTHSFTLTVDDGNGGTDSDTVDVTVKVGVAGLQPPLGALVLEGNPVPQPNKAFKQGRTLPLKLQLFCGATALTDADVAPPQIVALVPTGGTPVNLDVVDLDAGAANDNGLLFRYSDPNWVYNLSTKALSGGTIYTIVIEMPDGLRYAAAFALK